MNTAETTEIVREQRRVVTLIQLPSFVTALEEIASDPQAKTLAEKDIRGFLTSRHVPLERDIKVTSSAKRGAKGSFSVCLSISILMVCYQL